MIWLIAYSGSAVVRWFLLEFVGDAAIYVSSHTLNRFYETRQAIKTTSLDVARAVYEHGGCDRHILMGHSLGSVIAYDTLNRLIVDDEILEGRLRVAERTALLLTFGSILDKTAFLFRAQSEFSDVREALCSAGQPLISDAASTSTVGQHLLGRRRPERIARVLTTRRRVRAVTPSSRICRRPSRTCTTRVPGSRSLPTISIGPTRCCSTRSRTR